MEGIKIHTMRDDLVSARSSVNISATKGNPAKPGSRTELFPTPHRSNDGNLVLPRRNSSVAGRRKSTRWFIAGAAILIVLNAVIWGIAIMG